MNPTPQRVAAPGLVLLAVLLAAALVGCSGGDTGADGGDSGASGSVAGGAPAAADLDREQAPAADRVVGSAVDSADKPLTQAGPQQALIRKATVELSADDVGRAQFEAQQVVDRLDGHVTEEKTTTGDDGRPAYTRMVLRIPAERFDDAIEALRGLDAAQFEMASTSEDDVTTKMIDVRTRLKVQKRSIARITTLFDRAESIRDIMAIESQLSTRQADLDSLERQLSYLTSQTSLSTITLSIDQIPPKTAKKDETDHAGFLTGLSAGWHGLTTFAVALATVLGALLPWLVLLLVLGPPALLLGRAVRRRVHRAEPATPAEA